MIEQTMNFQNIVNSNLLFTLVVLLFLIVLFLGSLLLKDGNKEQKHKKNPKFPSVNNK
ncbi:MAG: hypothetical protein N3A54_04160 [Patescibacteria group bacterium]|nr:hypothetical protein [Patescibacteria group bacterium]